MQHPHQCCFTWFSYTSLDIQTQARLTTFNHFLYVSANLLKVLVFYIQLLPRFLTINTRIFRTELKLTQKFVVPLFRVAPVAIWWHVTWGCCNPAQRTPTTVSWKKTTLFNILHQQSLLEWRSKADSRRYTSRIFKSNSVASTAEAWGLNRSVVPITAPQIKTRLIVV